MKTNPHHSNKKKGLLRWLVLAALSFLLSSSLWAASNARFAVAPDSSLPLILSTINSAQNTINVNIYQLEHPKISQALITKIKSCLTVQMLVEGEPLGMVSEEGLKELKQIQQAMDSAAKTCTPARANKLLIMERTENDGIRNARRYRYNHAKYIIVDGQRTFVSSENFTPRAFAEPATVGNRGWMVAIDDVALAKQMSQMFKTDTDQRYQDVVSFRQATFAGTAPYQISQPVARSLPQLKVTAGSASSVDLVTSPNSLDGLLEIIQKAQSHLSIEMMSLPSAWRDPSKPAGQNKILSPIVAALVDAAKRKVQVRVLLNDERVFSKEEDEPITDDNKTANRLTAEFLMHAARCQKLPIEARVVDVDKAQMTYIHNKGITADDNKVLVGSINGSQNSVMNNREVALRIESRVGALFYRKAFEVDWTASPQVIEKTPCEGKKN